MPLLLLSALLMVIQPVVHAQDHVLSPDSSSAVVPVSAAQVPPELLATVDTARMHDRAALFIFNHSLHPLGKMEFMDNKQQFRKLNTPLKMNRCTLVYVDSGMHQLHTMYQLDGKQAFFHAGSIYFAELLTRTRWLVPGGIPNKNKNGEEFGAVLFNYINVEKGLQLFTDLKKKTILLNE